MSDADPSRIVADADVLAADLLIGGAARDALDQIRQHDWLELVASDPLLADAAAIIESLADSDLASDWERRIRTECTIVSHPAGDHPALASAYQSGAAHVLSLDDGLASANANRALQSHMAVSIRTPDAFTAVFDPARLYESRHDDPYPGPDREPRA